MSAPASPRTEPPLVGDERAQLCGLLDFLRATVVWKSRGLTDEQAHRRLVPSELTTVAGVLAHLRQAEEYWFGVVLGGMPDAWEELNAADDDADWRMGTRTPALQLIAEYETQCQISRDIIAALPLDHVASYNDKRYNARWVLLHLIDETARHAGHADLLRELLDGLTGE